MVKGSGGGLSVYAPGLLRGVIRGRPLGENGRVGRCLVAWVEHLSAGPEGATMSFCGESVHLALLALLRGMAPKSRRLCTHTKLGVYFRIPTLSQDQIWPTWTSETFHCDPWSSR